MSWGIIDTHDTGEKPGSEKSGMMQPLGRAEIFLRWLAFIPCALLVFIVAYYVIFYMGKGGWAKWFNGRPSMPPTPFLYILIFHVLASGLAGFMGVSLGALVAPAHRGSAGLGLLGMLCLWSICQFCTSLLHGDIQEILLTLLGGASSLGCAVYAVRSLANVFGWKGTPLVPGVIYWRPRKAYQYQSTDH